MSEIWVIDDDRSVRFVLAEALRDAGFAVRDFDNARAALSVLGQARPDAVFTDVRMPGMDGLRFLEALAAELPEVPVVVMSAYTDVASTAGAFRGGAFDFLSKPFDLDQAVATARKHQTDQDDAPHVEPPDPGGGKRCSCMRASTPIISCGHSSSHTLSPSSGSLERTRWLTNPLAAGRSHSGAK